MTRDDAKKIMLRIMARIEDEKAIHLDSGVEEIMAGMALVTPRPDTQQEQVNRQVEHELRMQELQQRIMNPWGGYTGVSDLMKGAIGEVTGISEMAHDLTDTQVSNTNPLFSGRVHQFAGVTVTKGADVTSITPEMVQRCLDSLASAEICNESWDADDHAQPLKPLPAADNPHGYAHADCHGVWSQQQMLDAGYHNDLQKMRYVPAKPIDMPIGTRLMLEFDATVPAGWKLISMTTEELLIEKVHD